MKYVRWRGNGYWHILLCDSHGEVGGLSFCDGVWYEGMGDTISTEHFLTDMEGCICQECLRQIDEWSSRFPNEHEGPNSWYSEWRNRSSDERYLLQEVCKAYAEFHVQMVGCMRFLDVAEEVA